MLWHGDRVPVRLQVNQEARIGGSSVPQLNDIWTFDQSLEFSHRHTATDLALLFGQLATLAILLITVLTLLKQRGFGFCSLFGLLLIFFRLFLLLWLHILEALHDGSESLICRIVVTCQNLWHHIVDLDFVVLDYRLGHRLGSWRWSLALRTLAAFSGSLLGLLDCKSRIRLDLFSSSYLLLLLQLDLFVCLALALGGILFHAFLVRRGQCRCCSRCLCRSCGSCFFGSLLVLSCLLGSCGFLCCLLLFGSFLCCLCCSLSLGLCSRLGLSRFLFCFCLLGSSLLCQCLLLSFFIHYFFLLFFCCCLLWFGL
mmetsp:Transcript_101151/g.179574  ORF Transcript_101151/g.179574 Transcript_101151/m.179574 type:complete len:312 (-) Transcript_101151:253-1188(-)